MQSFVMVVVAKSQNFGWAKTPGATKTPCPAAAAVASPCPPAGRAPWPGAAPAAARRGAGRVKRVNLQIPSH